MGLNTRRCIPEMKLMRSTKKRTGNISQHLFSSCLDILKKQNPVMQMWLLETETAADISLSTLSVSVRSDETTREFAEKVGGPVSIWLSIVLSHLKTTGISSKHPLTRLWQIFAGHQSDYAIQRIESFMTVACPDIFLQRYGRSKVVWPEIASAAPNVNALAFTFCSQNHSDQRPQRLRL